MYFAYIQSVKIKYINKKHHFPDEKYEEKVKEPI
jgi:hypothetical protein